MESATVTREMPHSIELQRAKDGQYYWTLKRYYESGEEAETFSELVRLDALLRQEFLVRDKQIP